MARPGNADMTVYVVDDAGEADENVIVTGAYPVGPAGGDLEGTYPNPTIKPSLLGGGGSDVDVSTPPGQAAHYIGTWDAGVAYTAGECVRAWKDAAWHLYQAAFDNSAEDPTGAPYVVTDSDHGGPTYDFVDISSTGTDVPGAVGDDVLSGAVAIAFGFDFFDVTKANLYVCSNGYLSFDAACAPDWTSADALPTNLAGPTLIAAMSHDLSTATTGTIKYQVVGSTPNRVLIVQYTNVPEWNHPAQPVCTMQVKLFEGSSNVEIHYQDVGHTNSLSGGTAGIQKDSSTAFQYLHSAGLIDLSGIAVRFAPYTIPSPAPWADITDPILLWGDANPITTESTNTHGGGVGAPFGSAYLWTGGNAEGAASLLTCDLVSGISVAIPGPDGDGSWCAGGNVTNGIRRAGIQSQAGASGAKNFISGDLVFGADNTVGPVIYDQSDGHTYRIISTAGVLSTVLVT